MKSMKRSKLIISLILILAVTGAFKITALATDQITGSFQTVLENVTAYESMDTASSKTNINAGEMILVAETNNGWIHILHDGQDLYIQEKNAGAIGSLDNAAAAQEIEQRSQTDKSWIESYVAQMKALRNARIWRIVIIALIVVVAAIIIYKGIKHNSKDETKEKSF